MSYRFKVSIQVDLVDGLKPYLEHRDGPNPFELEEWPDIRSSLQDQVLEDVPEEFESFLHSNRTGERFEYTIGEVVVSEDGELLEKEYDTSVESLRQAFENADL